MYTADPALALCDPPEHGGVDSATRHLILVPQQNQRRLPAGASKGHAPTPAFLANLVTHLEFPMTENVHI